MAETTNQSIEERFQHCSFCKIPKAHTIILIAGEEACICPNCALDIHKLVLEKTNIQTVNTARVSESIEKNIKAITVLLIILLATMVSLYIVFR
jgi:ClpX C4-type zinc finger protein